MMFKPVEFSLEFLKLSRSEMGDQVGNGYIVLVCGWELAWLDLKNNEAMVIYCVHYTLFGIKKRQLRVSPYRPSV